MQLASVFRIHLFVVQNLEMASKKANILNLLAIRFSSDTLRSIKRRNRSKKIFQVILCYTKRLKLLFVIVIRFNSQKQVKS